MQSLEQLKIRLREFAKERDWDQFHTPKNLSMALAGEAGELLEHFQWLTEKESMNLSDEKLDAVAQELADVQVYLVRLADKLGVGLADAVEKKMLINAEKYPADQVRGSAKKYDEY